MSDLCPSPCEPDCDFDCHEWHRMAAERVHDPVRCPGATESGLRRDLDEALEVAETPAEGCGQCETDPAREALSDRPGGRDGPPADEPSTPDPGMPSTGPETGPGATHTTRPVPHGGQPASAAENAAEGLEVDESIACARRFVPIADQIHAVIAAHYGDCPDRDGDPLCSEIAEKILESAW